MSFPYLVIMVLSVMLLLLSAVQLSTADLNETSYLEEYGSVEVNVTESSSEMENTSEVVVTLFDTTLSTAFITEYNMTSNSLGGLSNSTTPAHHTPSTSQSTTEATSTAGPLETARPTTKDDKQKFCGCDFLKDECDINCCCDNDCTEMDKKIFDHCYADAEIAQHTGLCYSRMFLYKNNTSYKILKEEKGLFCIAKDNLPERLQYTDQKIVYSFSTFNKIWNRRRHFVWNPVITKVEHKFINDYYRYGLPIWRYTSNASYPSNIALPTPFSSGLCDGRRIVKYLENIDSSCLMELTAESCQQNRAFNAAIFNNMSLIANPASVNVSQHSEIMINDEHLLQVQTILCDADETLCAETQTVPESYFDQRSSTCRNLLKSFDLLIKHNGSAGIVEAQLIIKLYNTKILQDDVFLIDHHQLQQLYRVTYEWAKNDSTTFRRSGTPGYLDGKPLICGSLISKKSGDKTEKYVHIDGEDDGQWFVIPKAVGHGGHCDGKMEVLFNSNVLSQCTLDLRKNNSNTTCESLHKMIWSKLFDGKNLNASNPNQLEVLISSLGNPEPLLIDQWVPIFLDYPSDYDYKSSRCSALISGVRYHILYSYYGSIVRPQAKLIGILAKLQTSRFHCANEEHSQCLFRLSTSVTFTDVSQKAINKFVKPPVIRIRLPSDFFYPFTSKSIIFKKMNLFLFAVNIMCSVIIL